MSLGTPTFRKWRKKKGSKRIWDKVIRNMWKTGRGWFSKRSVNDLNCYKLVKNEGRAGDHG